MLSHGIKSQLRRIITHMLDLELPRLSSAELVARFGNDEAALRRYRMLVALVREGRPTGEVARTFSISRESLRRLCHAFRREGLAALQSRKRGGGHLAGDTPLAQAIRYELTRDPGLSATSLWRRVQARLRDEGLEAPRSTFYRLLARMRDEERGPAGARPQAGLLREALTALVENPPIALGRSGLAELLLPNERDLLRRGRWLQSALRAAIEQLRPSQAGPVLDGQRWRHYLIMAGEYEAGEDRAALQNTLALSASTYSRAKREALERLLALLPGVIGDLPPPAPPADLFAPPPPPDVFDHEAELEQYMARLRRSGIALIWGPSGVGKFALAATLAARLQARGQMVVWHACRSPEAEARPGHHLLMTIAAALSLSGRQNLWQLLAAPEPTSLTQRLDALATALTNLHWTVIVVNTHWFADDEEAAQVFDVLTAAQERRDIRLALVGRSLPIWANLEQWPPLPFPSDAAARRAFLARLSDRPVMLPIVSPTLTTALRERVIELVTAIPIESLDSLPAEQIARILVELRPIESLAAELRTALQPPPLTGELF